MVTVSIYTSNGSYGRQVRLDLAKSEVGSRLMKSVAGGDGFNAGDMVKLDSGRLALTALLRLGFTPEQIKAALARQAERDRDSAALSAEVDDLLVAWQVAMGGEPARAGARKDEVVDAAALGGRKSVPAGTLRKSEIVVRPALRKSDEGTLCRREADRHGWKMTRSTADGGWELHHPGHGGHALSISPSGSWSHEGRHGKAIASGGAGQLAPHLRLFHHHAYN